MLTRRRMVLGGLAPVLGAVGLTAPAAIAKKNKKKGGKKTKFAVVSRTFTSFDVISITDQAKAFPYPSTINVSGFKAGKILDVNVVVRGIDHGYENDLDFLLEAPDGRTVLLMSDAGIGQPMSNVTLTFDDQATKPIDVGQVLTGSYRPGNNFDGDTFPAPAPQGAYGKTLAALNGANPNGAWRLYVVDDFKNELGGEIGSGWELKIRAKVKKGKA